MLGAIAALTGGGATAVCVPSEFTKCISVNIFAGESGYYEIDGGSMPSPNITAKVGDTLIFDQSDISNWYHPIGFAYKPDGAHGATWGGDELPEVEAAGELLYKIDGAATTCPDAGDTGLDCYEPEFFYPRAEWATKKYTAELTITQAMVDASHGGVIYYFCHIHSKMSGRIILQNADGSAATQADGSALANPTELPLYAPTTHDAHGVTCGTTGTDRYADGGAEECTETFIAGTRDTAFEQCLQAVDCAMNKQMRVVGHDSHADKPATFMQQMIPHHLNAVNMAKVVLKHAPTEVAAVEDLEDMLWNIINVQNYQVHQFRAYLGSHIQYGATAIPAGGSLTAESLGEHCSKTEAGYDVAITGVDYSPAAGKSVTDCTPSATTLCATVNVFAGESGYYEFAGHTGASPDITAKVGDTLVFDQSDISNWYHPIGFAYKPDGAHGATWGGDELPEVEAAGELLYKIDGAATTCPDAGDTGLDCYEPEFFYPRAEWATKKYTAELTITQAMVDASHGGVIYYFCHIHSKMSGRIILQNADGSAATQADGSALANPTELPLYAPSTPDPVDNVCGTTGLEKYSGGKAAACSQRFVCGELNTNFEKCLQAMDCAMNTQMYAETSVDSGDKVATFMQQMIPHHLNAVNMAKLLLKQAPAEVAAIDDGEDILMSIINVQNYQIHQFRNYLHPDGRYLGLPPPSPPPPEEDVCECTAETRAADAACEEFCAALDTAVGAAAGIGVGILVVVIVVPVLAVACCISIIVWCSCRQKKKSVV